MAGSTKLRREEGTRAHLDWPPKLDLFGVGISATDYDEAVEAITRAARDGRAATVDHMPVHGLVEFSRTAALRHKINSFDLAGADGQPVRWALNRLHGARLAERLYGPELMLKLCERAAAEGIAIYLYGSTPEVVAALRKNLLARFPDLSIAGHDSPPFRPLTPSEDSAAVARINASAAGLVFLGLGCPEQELFAYEHRHRVSGVQLCVGAAFELLAGTKPMAPAWMQRRGLEWLFRLAHEPRRLWRRYLGTNPVFLAKLARELARARLERGAGRGA